MRVTIHCHGISLTVAEREHVDRRVMFGLGRFASRIRHLAIRICDTNGGRGGIDKRCRLVARVNGLDELVIEDHHADLPALVDRSIARMGRLISRRLERLRLGYEHIAVDGTADKNNPKRP